MNSALSAPHPGTQAASRRTLAWLLVALIVGSAMFGGVVWSAATSALHQVGQTGPVSARYYLALFDRDYARAYNALDYGATIAGQRVDARSFASLARFVDRRDGVVRGFAIDGEDSNSASRVTVTVYRPSGSYTVHLQLTGSGADQRIMSADRL
jgi:hypothetical protein